MSAAGENTPAKAPRLAPPWQPGQSGNPAGRPKGARSKLGEAFVSALHDDFKEHGIAAIQRVRKERPDQYLRAIATVVPKEIEAGERLGNILEEILDRVDGRTRNIVPAQFKQIEASH